ncbi:MAG: peptidyl-prolyl cis-trans isomerase [Acidobacteria bacterium]|nr:peptidyl-prolyl cis-trans isomerase [Acidobacteriota bacterium]
MRSSRVLVVLSVLAALPALAAQPVLRIGGVEISAGQFKVATSAIQMARGASLDQNSVVRLAVDQLVVREVLVVAAHDAKLAADQPKVQAALDKQRAQDGPERFAKMLADSGLTEAELSQLESKRQLIQAFIDLKIAPSVTVSDQEVRAYYDGHPQQFTRPERFKLRMIVAEIPPSADQAKVNAAKARIDAAYQRVVVGEDFAAVAAAASDHASKSKGGEVGWVPRGGLPPELEKSFADLKPGASSPPLKTPFGYFIFKVDEKAPASTESFEAVQARLTKHLKDQKVNEAVQRYAAARSSTVKVEVLDPAIQAALAASGAGQPAAGPGAQRGGATATPPPAPVTAGPTNGPAKP